MQEKDLLMMVQVTCAPEHQEPFNRWYNSHLPNLLQIPGYLWAQRYVGLEDRNRFVALYGIRGEADLPILVQRNSPRRHPIALAEYAAWQKLQGLSGHLRNVYTQIAGTPLREPLLCSDRPLSLVTVDVEPAHEEAWDRWYTESHFPNVLKVPGYAMGGRFRALDHAALAGFNTGPRYLTLYEIEGEEVLPYLRGGPKARPEAREEFENWKRIGLPHARNVSLGYYRMVSKHFKWQEG